MKHGFGASSGSPFVIFDKRLKLEVCGVQLPDHWGRSGRTKWNDWGTGEPVQVELDAHDPAGTARFQVLPNATFCWADRLKRGKKYAGMTAEPPPHDPADYVLSVAMPRHRPSATAVDIVDVGPLPYKPWPAREQHHPSAAYVVVDYQSGGNRIRERMEFSVGAQPTQIQTAMSVKQGVAWFAYPAISLVTEDASMDIDGPLLDEIRSTFRVHPAWLPALEQYFLDQHHMAAVMDAMVQQQIRRSQQEIVRMRSEISQTLTEMSDTVASAYWEQQAAKDRLSHDWSLTTRGVDEWHDEVGPRVELPIGFSEAWRDGAGNYLASFEHGFDPNQLGIGTWTQLKRHA